jgi:hypothetical protein
MAGKAFTSARRRFPVCWQFKAGRVDHAASFDADPGVGVVEAA